MSKMLWWRILLWQKPRWSRYGILSGRNGRYVEPARFSERALRTFAADADAAPSDNQGTILLHDVADPTSSFVAAFGTFATDAVRLRTGRAVTIWIDPPPGDWNLAGLEPPQPSDIIAEYAVQNGRIFRVHPATATAARVLPRLPDDSPSVRRYPRSHENLTNSQTGR